MIRVRGAPFPPSTLSSALSQLRTKGFYGCLWNWASRARVNAATHLLKPTTPRNSALKSSPQSPSLPSTCSPARSLSSVVSDSNLCLCKSLFCIARKGSRRLRQFSTNRYQLTTVFAFGTTIWAQAVDHNAFSFVFIVFAVMRFFNRTILA